MGQGRDIRSRNDVARSIAPIDSSINSPQREPEPILVGRRATRSRLRGVDSEDESIDSGDRRGSSTAPETPDSVGDGNLHSLPDSYDVCGCSASRVDPHDVKRKERTS